MQKTKVLYKFSNKQLLFLEKIIPQRYAEVVENIRLNKYIEETDFENLSLQERKVCIINKGEWDYPLFQISFFSNMLVNIIDCLSKGYLPIVCFKNSKDRINLWEQFLEQIVVIEDTDNLENAVIYEKERAAFFFQLFPSKDDIDKIGKLLKKIIIMNKTTKEYVEAEYNKIIKGKRVLGVLCRGTDYTSNKPKGHPVQPAIDEVIRHVSNKINELNCSYIYLATEEEKILKQFMDAFPDKILTNQRYYYDEFYSIKEKNGDSARISQVHHNRENDNYYKSLEYLSSIYLLSKCDSLIAGNCGGSRAALYLNANKYQYIHLFDYGIY